MDLFDHAERKSPSGSPLADRMRPRTLDEIVGQRHLIAPGKLLYEAIAHDRVPSMILWGPPGTGKTTLAQVVANETRAEFVAFSAVLGGVPELREILKLAAEKKKLYGKRTTVFVDEIHRFNKAQQDALLPHVERGTITLIGATTENPSFAVNAALLSRARVFRLEGLSASDLTELLSRALSDSERGLGLLALTADEPALLALADGTGGDARRALDVLEFAAKHAVDSGAQAISEGFVTEALSARTLLYDKSGEEHYNVISAFIKSMRGSDPDAAIYWMMRMLEAGEDPLFLLRRMVIFASEDVGLADPSALVQAVAADQAFHRLGMPEGMFALAQCCHYLACAPKSNASYRSWKAAQEDVQKRGALPVPLKLRNASTKAMKKWGYGSDYRYAHDHGGYVKGETYLPDELAQRRYYEPKDVGFEAAIGERMRKLRGEDE
ncbi:MAG: ATPase, family [Myxococcaceae bacterium]|nr:ATPase, family [Myxococcaceae bacterium]